MNALVTNDYGETATLERWIQHDRIGPYAVVLTRAGDVERWPLGCIRVVKAAP